MKRFLLILIATMLPGIVALSQNMQGVKITHGPWLCDMTEDAVTVVWKTDVPAMSWVEFAEDDGSHFYGSEHPRAYDSAFGRRKTQETVHSVRIRGLKPGTRYMYRVFSQAVTGWKYSDYAQFGEIASSVVYKKEPYRFRTFSDDASSFRFFVLNDVHGRADDVRKLCAKVDFSNYDFVLLNGDMLSTTETEEQIFNGWLDACVELFAKEVPIVFARGNHENRGAYADNIFKYFPNESGRFYYSFDIAGVSILVLDCGEDKPDSDIEYGGIAEFDPYREEEAVWLQAEIGRLTHKRRIAFLHIPPGTSTWHGDKHLQELLMPILNEASISLMLSGHTHSFSLREPGQINSFPIFVNGNRTYLDVTVNTDGIKIEMVGETKKENKKFHFDFLN